MESYVSERLIVSLEGAIYVCNTMFGTTKRWLHSTHEALWVNWLDNFRLKLDIVLYDARSVGLIIEEKQKCIWNDITDDNRTKKEKKKLYGWDNDMWSRLRQKMSVQVIGQKPPPEKGGKCARGLWARSVLNICRSTAVKVYCYEGI